MEYWEVLDGEGKPTGKIMEKYDKKVFERGFYHLDADVWIINNDKNKKKKKRSPIKRLEPIIKHRWEFVNKCLKEEIEKDEQE